MLNLVAVLQKDKYTPRFYVAALTDNMSLQKAQVLEESLVHQVLFIILFDSHLIGTVAFLTVFFSNNFIYLHRRLSDAGKLTHYNLQG